MLKAAHLGKYKNLALLFTRYGRKDFRLTFAPSDLTAPEGESERIEPDVQARAEAFATALKKMGPTYVKFGQILSTRPDIVPPEYVMALESLQDDVEPFSFAEVEEIVESELEVRISKLFQDFDSKPLAAASLGQAHRAVLRDGRQVVVKIRRPGVREAVAEDLEVFRELAEFMDKHSDVGRKMNLVGTIEQAERVFTNELNYLKEAHNSNRLKRNLAEFPQIYIPEVIADLSTEKVLTTEFIEGRKVSKLTSLSLIDHDYAELAAAFTRAYLKQICVDGFWHSDPHPGNVFIHEDHLILLDFGMVSRLTREMQDEVIKFLLAATENRGQEVAEICMRVGTKMEKFDRDKFIRDVSAVISDYHDVELKNINTGQLMFNVISIANADELQVPSEFAMLAKTMLHLDGITRKLDPNFNPREAIRDYAEQLMSKKVMQKFRPRNFYSALIDLNELALELPRRMRELVSQTTTGNLGFKIKLEQVDDLLGGMHKIANRITVGLVIAAMIVGSALVMRVPTTFTLMGYPAIAVVGFIVASALGLYMVVSTLLQDRRDKSRAKTKMT